MEFAMDGEKGDASSRTWFVQSRPWASATDQDRPHVFRDVRTFINVDQLVAEGKAERSLSDTEPLTGPGVRLLLKGIPTSMAFSGRLVILDEESGIPFEDQIEDGDMIFAEETTPQHFRAMQKSKGVITLRGSNLSHAAIESRGLGISTVVGVENYLSELKETNPEEYLFITSLLGFRASLTQLRNTNRARYDEVMTLRRQTINVDGKSRRGLVITSDGNNGYVYLGELPTKAERTEIDINRANKNKLRRRIGFILSNALAAARATKLSALQWLYSISLLRAEFSFGYIGIHPRAVIAYDILRLLDAQQAGRITEPEERFLADYQDSRHWPHILADVQTLREHPEEMHRIEVRIRGFVPTGWSAPSAIQYFKEMHYATIGRIASSFSNDQVKVYRFLDFKLRELKHLIGGELFFKGQERQSMIGFRGQMYLNT